MIRGASFLSSPVFASAQLSSIPGDGRVLTHHQVSRARGSGLQQPTCGPLRAVQAESDGRRSVTLGGNEAWGLPSAPPPSTLRPALWVTELWVTELASSSYSIGLATKFA